MTVGIMKRLSTDRSLKEKFIGKGLLMEGLATVTAPVATIATIPAIVTAPSLPAKIGRFSMGTRERIKLRMAIDGPSGSGKSFTALRLAFALGLRVLVIDSEAGSASKYWGFCPDRTPWNFYAAPIKDYSPSEYATLIEDGGRAGFDVIIVDSLSHAWEGKDGALDLVSKNGGANKFTAWKDVTPMHRRMVEAILQSPSHVIVTMRSKTEYVLETENGKSIPRKIGVAPIQRPGMEYEFDIYCSMDWSHIMTISKTRCSAIDGMTLVKPGPDFMARVIEWLNEGDVVDVAPPTPRIEDWQLTEIMERISKIGWNVERAQKELPKKYACTQLHELTNAQADDFLKYLAGQIKVAESRAAKQAAAPAPAPTVQQPAAVETAKPAAVATTIESSPSPAATFQPDPAMNINTIDPTIVEPAAITAFPERITSEQSGEIMKLRLMLEKGGMPKENFKEKILAKRGVKTANDLTSAQADELIQSLRKALQKQHEQLNGSAQAKN